MDHSHLRVAFLALGLSGLLFVGCNQSGNGSAASATAAQIAPEKSLELIIGDFRRDVEETSIGFSVKDASGSKTMMTGRNVVSYDIVQPTDGEPLKAIVTVSSEIKYSMQRTTEKDLVDSMNAKNADSAEGSGDLAANSLPQDPTIAGGAPSESAVVVARTDDKEERKYELVYEGGRWKLLSKLDPKTEELIKLAFDRALANQG